MATLAANSGTQISLPAGSRIIFSGGAGTVSVTGGGTLPTSYVLPQTNRVGPFSGAVTAFIFANQDVTYTVAAANPAGAVPVVQDPASGSMYADGSLVSGGGNASAAWRISATKSKPQSFQGSVREAMGVVYRTATIDMAVVKSLDCGYNVADTNYAAAYTVQRTIEYPIGSTPQALKWGGATSGTVSPGLDVESDSLTLAVPIPKGALFIERTFVAGASGAPLAGSQNTGMGDRTQWSGSVGVVVNRLNDNTFPTNTDTVNMAVSVALVTLTNEDAWAVAGDSRVAGVNDVTTTTTYREKGELGRTFEQRLIPGINWGIAGYSMSQFVSLTKQHAFIRKYCTGIIVQYGVNGSAALATMQTQARAIWALFPNLKKYQCTVCPKTSGAWTLADGSDQTLTASQSDWLLAWNNWLTGGQDEVRVLDLATAVSLPADKRKWIGGGITDDGLHEITAGNMIHAGSGAVSRGTL